MGTAADMAKILKTVLLKKQIKKTTTGENILLDNG